MGWMTIPHTPTFDRGMYVYIYIYVYIYMYIYIFMYIYMYTHTWIAPGLHYVALLQAQTAPSSCT